MILLVLCKQGVRFCASRTTTNYPSKDKFKLKVPYFSLELLHSGKIIVIVASNLDVSNFHNPKRPIHSTNHPKNQIRNAKGSSHNTNAHTAKRKSQKIKRVAKRSVTIVWHASSFLSLQTFWKSATVSPTKSTN